MELTDISLQSSLYLKFMLYGESGAGKTTLIGTAVTVPDLSPLLILNCVGNPFSIRNIRPKPCVLNIDEPSDLDIIYPWLRDGQDPNHPIPMKWKEKMGWPMPLPFKSVSLDSATGLNGLYMRKELGLNKATDKKKATFDNWGGLLQFNEAIGYNFFEHLNMHTFITALEWIELDPLTQAKSWGIGLHGRGQSVLPSYAYLTARIARLQRISDTAVAAMELKTSAYSVAFFDQLGKFAAKDLYGLGMKYMAEPTMHDIWAAVNRGRNEGQDTPTDSKGDQAS